MKVCRFVAAVCPGEVFQAELSAVALPTLESASAVFVGVAVTLANVAGLLWGTSVAAKNLDNRVSRAVIRGTATKVARC